MNHFCFYFFLGKERLNLGIRLCCERISHICTEGRQWCIFCEGWQRGRGYHWTVFYWKAKRTDRTVTHQRSAEITRRRVQKAAFRAESEKKTRTFAQVKRENLRISKINEDVFYSFNWWHARHESHHAVIKFKKWAGGEGGALGSNSWVKCVNTLIRAWSYSDRAPTSVCHVTATF